MSKKTIFIKYLLPGLLLVFILISCAGVRTTAPQWVINHPQKGAVGKCGWSPVPGKQEELARTEALVILATQYSGANVDIKKILNRYATNDKVRAEVIANHKITMQGITVKGKIKDTWKDPKTGIYYVWMVRE